MKSKILELLAASEKSKMKRKHLVAALTDAGEQLDDEKLEKALRSLEKKGKIAISDNKISLSGHSGASTTAKVGDKREAAAPVEEEVVPKKTQKVDETTKSSGKTGKKAAGVQGGGDRFELWKNGEAAWRDQSLDYEYLSTNPDKITRLFVGNLKKEVTEEQLNEQFPGITYIKWIRDKDSGEFYGTTFLELADAKAAAHAVMKDRTKYLGRPLKIYYCPPKPGDQWPPVRSGGNMGKPTGFAAASAGGGFVREKTPKPPGCCKLFMGNLSYNIDDESAVEFFADCGGEMTGLRWLTHQGSGEFRGCGYAEFSDTETADKAFAKDGMLLLGRPIRLDWA